MGHDTILNTNAKNELVYRMFSAFNVANAIDTFHVTIQQVVNHWENDSPTYKLSFTLIKYCESTEWKKKLWHYFQFTPVLT